MFPLTSMMETEIQIQINTTSCFLEDRFWLIGWKIAAICDIISLIVSRKSILTIKKVNLFILINNTRINIIKKSFYDIIIRL